MTKITELISFYPTYGEQVRLLDYYYDENQNQNHISGYVPIRSHREAFLDLARAQLPVKPKAGDELKGRTFMLTGSYGTGKSHLCLMLANYFSLKPTNPQMQEFFKNWGSRDEDTAQNVRNWRGDGRYLVAPCDFSESKLFDEMLLDALDRALKEEGVENLSLDSHFKAAVNWIEDFEKNEKEGNLTGTFSDFLNHLGGDEPRNSLKQLKEDLNKNLNAAMDQFQAAYQKATKSKMKFKNDSLIDILRDLLSNQNFKKIYKGLVFIADEFGYALNEGRVSMSLFQGFSEMSKDGVDGEQLIFIGTGHRRFEAYGANTPLQVDFRVVKDRVVEVSLESEEIEQIIASLISPDKKHDIWKEEILKNNSWLLTKMAGDVKRLNIFNYLSEPDLLDQIVKNIYPMHPLATYCLTKMSVELGSGARSVFSFFRQFGKNPPLGNYSWFVQNFDITKPNGELEIYTPEFLSTYFKPDISSTNVDVRPEIRDHIRNYLTAVEEVRRYAYKNTLSREIDTFTQRVLDLIFVYRVSNVNVIRQTLEVGLNISSVNDKRMLESELKSLLTNRILFQSPSGEYEFRRSEMEDLETLINDSKRIIQELPFNLSEQVRTLAEKKWDIWTEAKGHNQDYSGDKRLFRVFAVPQELVQKFKISDGSEVDFWTYQEIQRKNKYSWNERYEGTMVFIICENDQDIQVAQLAVKSNHMTNVIVGIPRSPIPIKETILNLLAIQKFMESEKYMKLEFQEKSIVDEMLGNENQKTGRMGDFIHARDRYLNARELFWYRDDGKTLVADPTNEYDPADILMNRLFNKRVTVSHEYINKIHPKSFSGSKDSALREAVSNLIQYQKPIQIDHGEKENRGEIRYLKLALANNGILVQTGDYEGNIAFYELENNSNKYLPKFPGLFELIEKIKILKRGESLDLWPLLSEMIDAPFGLGPYALSIFFSCIVRYFGDELRLKVDPAGLGFSDTSDPDIIIDVSTGKFPLAIVEKRLLTAATSKLINEIYQSFSKEPAAAGSQQTLSETWWVVQGWWKERTRLEKALGIYNDDTSAQNLVDFLTKYSENNSGSQILLEQVKQIYGYNEDAILGNEESKIIIDELKDDIYEIETRASRIKEKIISTLAILFNPNENTYQDYINSINNWLKNLHPEQKILTADWQTPITRTVLEAFTKLVDIEKTFLEVIPGSHSFSLGKVDDWGFDQTESYINRFKDAISKIDTSLPKVPSPIFSSTSEISKGYMGTWAAKFHGSTELKITSPSSDLKVKIAKNEDPLNAKQALTVDQSEQLIKVEESCTYFLVTINSQNETSRIEQITFTNLDDDSKLISEPTPNLDPKERIYRFKIPCDASGLIVLLKDIIAHINKDELIPKKDLIKALETFIKIEMEKK